MKKRWGGGNKEGDVFKYVDVTLSDKFYTASAEEDKKSNKEQTLEDQIKNIRDFLTLFMISSTKNISIETEGTKKEVQDEIISLYKNISGNIITKKKNFFSSTIKLINYIIIFYFLNFKNLSIYILNNKNHKIIKY